MELTGRDDPSRPPPSVGSVVGRPRGVSGRGSEGPRVGGRDTQGIHEEGRRDRKSTYVSPVIPLVSVV